MRICATPWGGKPDAPIDEPCWGQAPCEQRRPGYRRREIARWRRMATVAAFWLGMMALAAMPSVGVLGIWWSVPIGWLLADLLGFGFYRRLSPKGIRK